MVSFRLGAGNGPKLGEARMRSNVICAVSGEMFDASASVWCFATDADRSWWGGMWADRVVASAFADQAVDRGFATRDELEDLSDAWRSWSTSPDGWFAILHGEIRARP